MKRLYFLSMISIFLIVCINRLQAQTAPPQPKQVYLDNTEQFSIESKYVKEENYTYSGWFANRLSQL